MLLLLLSISVSKTDVGTEATQKVIRGLGHTCSGNKDRLHDGARALARELGYQLGDVMSDGVTFTVLKL